MQFLLSSSACPDRRVGMQTCFGSKYNKHEGVRWAVDHFEDNAELSQADFAMLFSFPVFAALQEYGQDGM